MFGSYDSIEEDYIFDKRNDYTDAYIRMMPSYKVSFFFIEKKLTRTYILYVILYFFWENMFDAFQHQGNLSGRGMSLVLQEKIGQILFLSTILISFLENQDHESRRPLNKGG